MIYGDKIKHIRERNNIKQKDLIEEIKISKSLYSEYENETKTMPIKHLNKICNRLNVSIDFIFGLTKEKQYTNINKVLELDPKLIGSRIRQFRKSQKITQKDLAKIVGCNFATISDYENGHYLVSIPVIFKLVKTYKISADYFLGRIDTIIKL